MNFLYAGSKREVKGNCEGSRLKKNILIKIGLGELERNSVLYLWNLKQRESFGGMLLKWRVSLAKIMHNFQREDLFQKDGISSL